MSFETQFLLPSIFFFLLLDVPANCILIATYRGHKVPSCPKVVPDEVAPSVEMDASHVYSAFALDVSNDLRY